MGSISCEDLEEGVRRIAVARPEARNAITPSVRDELAMAIDHATQDHAVRAVILTAEGPNFSVGGDIDFLRSLDRPSLLAFHRDSLGLVRKLAAFPKPLVAAVRGACAGGSVGFALCADYLVISGTAFFGIQFMRIGLTPDMGVVYLLKQRLGRQAYRMILDDQLIRAKEAKEIGLCDLLVDDASLEIETLALAKRLAKMAPLAFRQTKWLMSRANGDFDRYLDEEMSAAADCFGSAEFTEGMRAFLEKRTPRFDQTSLPAAPGHAETA